MLNRSVGRWTSFWKSSWARPRLDRSTEVDPLINRRQVRDRKNSKVRPTAQLFKSTYFRSSQCLNGLGGTGDFTTVVMTNPLLPWAAPWAGQLHQKRVVKGVVCAPKAELGAFNDSADAVIARLVKMKASWDVEDAGKWKQVSAAAASVSYHASTQGLPVCGVDCVSSVLNSTFFVCSGSLWARYQLNSRSDVNNTIGDINSAFNSLSSPSVVALGNRSLVCLIKAIATFEVRVPSLEVACSIAFAEAFHSLSAVECLEGCRCLLRIGFVASASTDVELALRNVGQFFQTAAPILCGKFWLRLAAHWKYFMKKGFVLDAVELLHLGLAISGFSIPRMSLPDNHVTRAPRSLKYCFLRFTLGVDDAAIFVTALRSLSKNDSTCYLRVVLKACVEAWDDLACAAPSEERRFHECTRWAAGLRSAIDLLGLDAADFADLARVDLDRLAATSRRKESSQTLLLEGLQYV